jgi:hypothetical protein
MVKLHGKGSGLRIVKEQTGEGIGEGIGRYIRDERVQVASRLLQHHRMSFTH